MPVPAINAQSLEEGHRSAEEHLESSTKELQPVSQLHQGPNLKCLFANAHSMGNKQAELEKCPHLHRCDFIGIMETWWYGFCDWSDGMEGYGLFRKDRQGRQGALYVKD